MSDQTEVSLQRAIRARLISTPSVTALVPAGNVIDAGGLPSRFPCILIGETQLVRDSLTLSRQHVRVYATLHCWAEESGLVGVKRLAGAVAIALRAPLVLASAEAIDGTVDEIRSMRDPGGEHSHAVVTYSALIKESV